MIALRPHINPCKASDTDCHLAQGDNTFSLFGELITLATLTFCAPVTCTLATTQLFQTQPEVSA